MAIVAATDASKIPLPSPETEGSRPPTPVVVQLELAERQHSSSTKTSEEALAQERVDLAPVAVRFLLFFTTIGLNGLISKFCRTINRPTQATKVWSGLGPRCGMIFFTWIDLTGLINKA